MKRQLEERCGTDVVFDDGKDVAIITRIDPALHVDGFTIASGDSNEIIIAGSNIRAVYFGLGKLLRTSTISPGKFIPGKWRGTSIPDTPFRGVYLATHFFNFYHVAPIKAIQDYIEDLALWGFNTIVVWYDMHHFNGIADPGAKPFIDRLRDILARVKGLGLQAGLTTIANEGYANSPPSLRADQTFPGSKHVRGGYGVELCPSKPGALELIDTWFEEQFAAFEAVDPDVVMIWPYDQGGCGCPGCKPWGANGFLRAAERVANIARRHFPGARIILSTWLFDSPLNEGEWAGLNAKFSSRPGWVDYILADSHDAFPAHPLEHGVPGGLPLLNFPEISMWGMSPWGGYGANPLPARFQAFWDRIKDRVSGGLLYSEGLYEDLNKAIWAQFYWSRARTAVDTLREYVAYEFPGCNVDDVVKAIHVLEQNHRGFTVKRWRKRPAGDAGSKLAARAFVDASQVLPQHVTRSWRWRVLFHRAMLDVQRFRGHPYPNNIVWLALDELVEIYHAGRAEPCVRPPTRRRARTLK